MLPNDIVEQEHRAVKRRGASMTSFSAIGAISARTYNLRGFATQVSDADVGAWTLHAD